MVNRKKVHGEKKSRDGKVGGLYSSKNHRRNGSSSPELTATCLSYGSL